MNVQLPHLSKKMSAWATAIASLMIAGERETRNDWYLCCANSNCDYLLYYKARSY